MSAAQNLIPLLGGGSCCGPGEAVGRGKAGAGSRKTAQTAKLVQDIHFGAATGSRSADAGLHLVFNSVHDFTGQE